MSFLWSLWEITVDIIDTLVFVIFLIKQLGYTKEIRVKVWGGFLCLAVALAVLNLNFTPPWIVVGLIAVANIVYALVAFQSVSSPGACVLGGCSGSLISLIANSIVNNIAVRQSDFPGSDILVQSTFRFEMMCLYVLIYIVLFMALYYITKNRKDVSMSFRSRALLIAFMVFSTTVMGLIAQITILSGSPLTTVHSQITSLTAVITGILFIIILFTLTLFEYMGVLYNNNLKLQLSVQQQKDETARYHNINGIYQDLREMKHDYHNHLLVMQEFVKTRSYDQLETYLGQLNQNYEQVERAVNTGCTALDAIIYNKMILAKHHGISFTSEVMLTKPIAVSDLNLSSILGNLLDNALEANLRLAPDMRENGFIHLYITTEKQMALLSISNYYDGKILYQNGRLRTHKKDFTEHGIGLSRVEKLLQQENGFLNIDVDEHIFTAEVLLPVKGEVE